MFTEPYLTQLVQLALQPLGLYSGKIDGVNGPKTQVGFDAYVKLNRPAPVQVPDFRKFKDEFERVHQIEMVGFKANWQRNLARYNLVGQAAQVPPALVAAIHWREADGNFKTYLHQGDPLGKPAVHVPSNIPLFKEWEPAAIHALKMKEALRIELGINFYTVDVNALCDYAEHYNGLGYRKKGLPSPYVLGGTEGYEKGHYVADGKFDPNAVDRELGVLPMLRACGLS